MGAKESDFRGDIDGFADVVKKAYQNAFGIAKRQKHKLVGSSLLSTGVFAKHREFKERAIRCAVQAAMTFEGELEIHLIAHTDNEYESLVHWFYTYTTIHEKELL